MEFSVFAAGFPSRKTIPPMLLFFGAEALLRRRGAEMVREADPALAGNTLRCTSSETSWPSLLGELCTASLMGGRKLVVLADESNWIHNEAANLKAYAAAPSPSSVLVLLSPAEKAPLSFESKTFLSVSCRPLSPVEAHRWVEAELQLKGKTLERGAVERLVARAGTGLDALASSIETLSLHAGSHGRIGTAEIDALVGDDSEHEVFELALAAARRDRRGALILLHRLVEAGENAHSLLWRIAWQYRKMAEARRLLDSGVRRFEVTSRLQITYYADKFLAWVDAHTPEELLAKHQAILETDLALKSSGRGAEETILDSLLFRLTAETAAVS